MIRGVLLIAFASLLWATTSIVAKFLFADTDLQPLTLGLVRLLVALPFFWWLMKQELDRAADNAGQRKRLWPPLGGRGLLVLASLGLFQAFYQGSYLMAVDAIGAGIATLISLCLPPVLVAILAAPLLGEKPRLVTVIALVAAIAGTGMLVASDIETAGSFRLTGILLALLAAAVYTGFNMTSRYNSAGTPVFTTAFVCFLVAALLLLPPVWLSGGFAGLASLGLNGWLMVIYIGVVPTCVGYVCFFTGMKTTPATLASIIVTLEPLFVALLAWLILDEVLGMTGIAGALILTLAVIVASASSRRQPTTPREETR